MVGWACRQPTHALQPMSHAQVAGVLGTTIRASFTNDDPGATPAQALTGDVRKTYSGDCPGEVAWTVTATRTGD